MDRLYFSPVSADQEGAAVGRQRAFTFTLDQKAATQTGEEEEENRCVSAAQGILFATFDFIHLAGTEGVHCPVTQGKKYVGL